MERRLKERLTGAAVLLMLAVIFIPMILDNSVDTDTSIHASNIPPGPEVEFSSRISPLQETDLAIESLPEEIGVIKEEVTDLLDELPAVLAGEAPRTEIPVEPKVSPAPVVGKTETEAMGVSAWAVQLGSFSNEANANALNKKLRNAAYPSFVEPLRQASGKMAYRVRVGPELLRSDAEALKEKLDRILNKEGIQGLVVRYP